MNFLTRKHRRTEDGIRFAVDDVTPAKTELRMDRLDRAFGNRLGRAVQAMPEPERQVVKVAPRNPFSNYCPPHPLIDAVHLAFSQHRPLVLSPDSIWLVLAQGFGHHVNENAERLRSRMVAHAGKQRLVVKAESVEEAVACLSVAVRDASDPVLHETLVCDFSTSTPITRTASEVALLDTLQHYFEYVMDCICGIPEITLQGTPDDWRRIRARIEVLATYDLEWWASRLRPILDEFVRTAEERPSRTFWKAIYKPAPTYGTELATGWITDLFPYLGDPPLRRRNPVFGVTRTDWCVPVERGISPDSFPSGLSRATLQISRSDGGESSADLIAGFVAVGQRSPDLALYPVIGWSLAERDLSETNWDAFASRFPAQRAKSPDFGVMMKGALELVHFAGRFDWMDLPLKKRQWRIVPSFELEGRDGKVFCCFARELAAMTPNGPGQVLALGFEREGPEGKGRPVKRVYLCDLRPGYDLDEKDSGAGRPLLEQMAPNPAVVNFRAVGTELFPFLSELISREGEPDRQ